MHRGCVAGAGSIPSTLRPVAKGEAQWGRGMWLQLQGTGAAFVAAVAMLVSDNCNHVPSVTESLVYCPGLAEF